LERYSSHRVVVMGEFNFPNIDWNLFSSNSLDGADFIGCVLEGFLTHYVDTPTRGEATLDLVLRNEPGQMLDLLVGELFGVSDHTSISVNCSHGE